MYMWSYISRRQILYSFVISSSLSLTSTRSVSRSVFRNATSCTSYCKLSRFFRKNSWNLYIPVCCYNSAVWVYLLERQVALSNWDVFSIHQIPNIFFNFSGYKLELKTFFKSELREHLKFLDAEKGMAQNLTTFFMGLEIWVANVKRSKVYYL